MYYPYQRKYFHFKLKFVHKKITNNTKIANNSSNTNDLIDNQNVLIIKANQNGFMVILASTDSFMEIKTIYLIPMILRCGLLENLVGIKVLLMKDHSIFEALGNNKNKTNNKSKKCLKKINKAKKKIIVMIF